MLRIHFTAEDLGRTRLAGGPEPMWEILLSLHKLADGRGRMVFDGWRRAVRARQTGRARWLPRIAPPIGYSPDFLTPPVAAGRLDVGLDHVLSTPRARIRKDFTRLAETLRPTGPTMDVADGRLAGLKWLEQSFRDYHRLALAPFWDRIQSGIHTDLAVRRADLRGCGIERVLTGVHPRARWRGPVLELPYPSHRDIRLDGRGLRLIPSFFCWETPFALCDLDPIPALAYPIEHDLGWLADADQRRSDRPLAALLGRTRAAVLSTVAAEGGCTTSHLAQTTGVSVAAASQHATVLREAGLITSTRRGGCVIHTLRRRGASLFQAPAG